MTCVAASPWSCDVVVLRFEFPAWAVVVPHPQGRLTSHSMLDLSMLTAVQAHATEIVQLLPCYKYGRPPLAVFLLLFVPIFVVSSVVLRTFSGVVSVGYDSARVYNRGGLVLSEILASHLPPVVGKVSEASPSILCALGVSHIATSNTLPSEARLAVATDCGSVHMFDLTSPAAAVGVRRPPKPLASLEVAHDVGLMRANHRIMVAASGTGRVASCSMSSCGAKRLMVWVFARR
jgi:hypothetical protein